MPVFGRFKLTLIAGIAVIALSGCGAEPQPEVVEQASVEPIISDPANNDLPNPNPTVIREWGPLPDGRTWGSTAGVDAGPHGAAGEGVAVDPEGNVYAAEGPNSRPVAGGGLTKYIKQPK